MRRISMLCNPCIQTPTLYSFEVLPPWQFTTSVKVACSPSSITVVCAPVARDSSSDVTKCSSFSAADSTWV